jgi:hypothetical protein
MLLPGVLLLSPLPLLLSPLPLLLSPLPLLLPLEGLPGALLPVVLMLGQLGQQHHVQQSLPGPPHQGCGGGVPGACPPDQLAQLQQQLPLMWMASWLQRLLLGLCPGQLAVQPQA